MKTITKTETAYLHLSKYIDGEYVVYMTDMSEYGDVLVATQEIEFSIDIPEDFNPNNARVDSLKAEKQKIAGDAQIKMNNIEEQIQSLLAIEDHSNDLSM